MCIRLIVFSIFITGVVMDAAGVSAQTEPSAPRIVPLFDADTALEPETTIDTGDAIVTRVADRVRDRHARESMFHAYDHYLSWYWEERTVSIEIVDRIAKGGSEIAFEFETLTPLSPSDFRAFYRGLNTVAEYQHNARVEQIGPNRYSTTLRHNPHAGRAIQIGDPIEFEFSPFLESPTNGRKNYYGTTMLYVVGQGIVAWEAVGEHQQSIPLTEDAWLGGATTLPYQYSDEPEHRFKQMATNLAPESAIPFMLGRRLHHTDFGDGSHSEQPNPADETQANKLGPGYVARSCIACHHHNGRSVAPNIGEPMYQSVVKVGDDAEGSPHSQFATSIQPQSTGRHAEPMLSISDYEMIDGEFGDGESFQLRKPSYDTGHESIVHYSVRVAPPLVGLGLLEAIDEQRILTLADPNDLDRDGISGRVQVVVDPQTGDLRLGRFGYKAGQARLIHQIAHAFNRDMGVRSSIFPSLDGETEESDPEISHADLNNLTRYVSTLGVSARRDVDDADTQLGEELFTTAQCASCHTPTMTTSPFHPLAELRNQKIHAYTDLLLHDMGPGLADSMGEHMASGSEWRTAPLWNIGLTEAVGGEASYLHDGRARTLEEAILWHGGEAESSKEQFRTMSETNRDALIAFLRSL